VRDTGVGFDPKQFDPDLVLKKDCGQTPAELGGGAQRYEQSGLGLMLAHKYLDLIGAPLTITSSPGKGSVFTITFPSALEEHWEPWRARSERAAPAHPAAPVPPAPAPQSAIGEGAIRTPVLVVEDQPDQALYMRALLKGTYEVVGAVNAGEALARLEELGERVGLILMDLSLPGGEDGLSLTRRLRADRRWHRVPIVVTTAHAFDNDRARALAAGANAYLAKPIDAGALLATVARLVRTPTWPGGTLEK
jgi:two-component system, sensor histidine kinase ChiS